MRRQRQNDSSAARPTSRAQRVLTNSAEKKQKRIERMNVWRERRERERVERKYDSDDDEKKFSAPVNNIFDFNNLSAMGGISRDFTLTVRPEIDVHSIDDFKTESEGAIREFLRQQIERNRQIKFRIVIQAELIKENENGVVKSDTDVYLASITMPIYQSDEIQADIDIAFLQIHEQLDAFNRNGSNWTLHRVSRCVVSADRWVGVRGAGSYFPTPEWIQLKGACINIENNDEYCFKYVMEAGYNLPKKNPQRSSHYKGRNNFIFPTALEFPFNGQNKVFKQFEKLNSNLNICITAYFADKSSSKVEDITVLYQSNEIINSDTKYIDVLMIENKDDNRHWVLIKNMSRLFSFGHNNLDICRRCLVRMSKEKVTEHLLLCNNQEHCKVEYPTPELAFAGFKSYQKKLEAPFAIYADFECVCEKRKQDKFINNENILRTHVPNAYCYFRVCNFDENFCGPLKLYRSSKDNIRYDSTGAVISDVAGRLIDALNDEKVYIFEVLKRVLTEGLKKELNENDRKSFDAATECHICGLPFNGGCLPQWKNYEVDSVKVRDHDHLSRGKHGSNYRGAAHAWCNLQFNIGFEIVDKSKEKPIEDLMEIEEEEEEEKEEQVVIVNQVATKIKFKTRRYKIPVIFHNLKGYDGHLILRAINAENVVDNIFSIPQNGEKFMSFSFNSLKFIDSFQFLSTSLEKLVDTVRNDGGAEQFIYLTKQLPQICGHFGVAPNRKRMELLIRKGQYPYDYMDSFDRFDETSLPPKIAFKSILDGSEINDEEYSQAEEIWKEFNIQNLGQYHDLYLLTDVILLTDVFQKFRKEAIKDTNLEVLHYVSLPGFSLDACYLQSAPLKMSKTASLPERLVPFQVQVFSTSAHQKDMYLFCEDAVRGGISMIPGRHAEANHKFMKNFDPSKPSYFIMYLDANNLYGWAMCQYMPIGDYVWITDLSRFTSEFIANLGDFDDFGYFFEVDLHIPKELHDKFKDYPLAPENRSVLESELSPYTKALHEKLKIKHDQHTKKLLCTLCDKVKYKVHYRNLKLYLSLGYVLTKVHHALRFRQSKWIEPYIMGNTKKRAVATNDFLKDFLKLKNNSVFGKFLQDNRKHQQAEICNTPWKYEKLVSSPFFDCRTILNQDTTIAYMKKKKIKLDKPIIVGASILELSKLLMYDFYYNTMKRVFGDRVRLLMTDTDSLQMQIQTDDFHQEIKDNNLTGKFDWSNYPKDHIMYDPRGKAQLGLFKDETAGEHIIDFVGLRSKMYSVLKDIPPDWHPPLVMPNLEKKVAKGIKKHLIKSKLRHELYKECLTDQNYDPNLHRENMVGFKTYNNLIHTVQINKTTLSAADDKLWQVNGIDTLPIGHARTLIV